MYLIYLKCIYLDMVGKCRYRFSSVIVHSLLWNPLYFTLRLTWLLISLGGLAVGAASREAGFHPQWFGLRGTSRSGGHVGYPTAAWNRFQQVLTTHQPDIQSPWKHTHSSYTQYNRLTKPVYTLHTWSWLDSTLISSILALCIMIPITSPNMEGNCVFITCWRVLW